MNRKYEILPGDLVLLLNASYFTEWNGTIGLVIEELRYKSAYDLGTQIS